MMKLGHWARVNSSAIGTMETRQITRPLVRSSPWRILWSNFVHILPVSACVALLVLNIRTYYIGAQLAGAIDWSDTSKLQLLQVAAKIHEIAVVASLATIVFTLVRYRLFYSKHGLPLGLVGLGFTFANATFFT
jgi:hypothetical protein